MLKISQGVIEETGSYLLSVKRGAMDCQEERRGRLMAGTAEGTLNLIRSGLILGASKWIQRGSDTPSIKLSVGRSNIKIVREL
jgi:hypothetical protein